MKYEIVIYWSNADNVFVAEVPELIGCTAHGATHESALESIKSAAAFWIETALEDGDPIPEPQGRLTSV
jgi:predicted RNase H-like HicB family nuclease